MAISSKTGRTSSGIHIHWGAEHKDGHGRLISRQVSIEPPEITCVKHKCLWNYFKLTLKYMLLLLYHEARTEYAEKHRNDEIPERYRTGVPFPLTIWQLLVEIGKLK